jgi:hypothetical protein
MYLYTDFDQQLINQRVAQFRDQTERYLAGKFLKTNIVHYVCKMVYMCNVMRLCSVLLCRMA